MVFGVRQLNYTSRIWLRQTLVAMVTKIFDFQHLVYASRSILTKLFQSMCHVHFLEGSPQKNLGARKNVQNSARFVTTFEFDLAYLRNGLTCGAFEKICSPTTPSTLGEKMANFGPQAKKVLLAHIDQPKWTFFGRLHFRHYRVLPLKFLHALEIEL